MSSLGRVNGRSQHRADRRTTVQSTSMNPHIMGSTPLQHNRQVTAWAHHCTLCYTPSQSSLRRQTLTILPPTWSVHLTFIHAGISFWGVALRRRAIGQRAKVSCSKGSHPGLCRRGAAQHGNEVVAVLARQCELSWGHGSTLHAA